MRTRSYPPREGGSVSLNNLNPELDSIPEEGVNRRLDNQSTSDDQTIDQGQGSRRNKRSN